jgi:hypothetical protein
VVFALTTLREPALSSLLGAGTAMVYPTLLAAIGALLAGILADVVSITSAIWTIAGAWHRSSTPRAHAGEEGAPQETLFDGREHRPAFFLPLVEGVPGLDGRELDGAVLAFVQPRASRVAELGRGVDLVDGAESCRLEQLSVVAARSDGSRSGLMRAPSCRG